MSARTMSRVTVTVMTLGVLIACSLYGGAAKADEGSWQIRATGVSIQTTSGEDWDDEIGFGLGLEYRISDRFGIEVSAVTGELERSILLEALGHQESRFITTLRTTPLLAGLNFHLTPNRRADVYVGPVAGFAGYGDLEVAVELRDGKLSSKFETDDEFVFGGQLGMDLRLGESDSFLTAGITYLDAPLTTSFDDDFAEETDLDLLLIRVGYSHRF